MVGELAPGRPAPFIFLLPDFSFRRFASPRVHRLAPAMRGRLSRQQEAPVPPEGLPQFSCVTLRPGARPFSGQAREGNQTKEK
jgi:hypothetical protein